MFPSKIYSKIDGVNCRVYCLFKSTPQLHSCQPFKNIRFSYYIILVVPRNKSKHTHRLKKERCKLAQGLPPPNIS